MNKQWKPARRSDIHVEKWVRGRVPGIPFEGYVSKVESGPRGLVVTVAAEGRYEPIICGLKNLRVRR